MTHLEKLAAKNKLAASLAARMAVNANKARTIPTLNSSTDATTRLLKSNKPEEVVETAFKVSKSLSKRQKGDMFNMQRQILKRRGDKDSVAVLEALRKAKLT